MEKAIEITPNNRCCGGVEMENVGFKIIDGVRHDMYRCNGCEQVIGMPGSKFDNGKLRADGLNDRYLPNCDELYRKDVDGLNYAGAAEADERKRLNTWNMLASKGIDTQFKTREQRRAELATILEREVEL